MSAGPESADWRAAAVESVLADPPHVHAVAGGVWSTAPDAYTFLAAHCGPGARTLETGLGVSTVLFALWKTEHTCVVPDPEEVERLKAYFDSRGIDQSSIRFEVAPSDRFLPTFEGPLDMLLVDGSHAFPAAILDWYYGGSCLGVGGHVVLDDWNLTPVELGLRRFLDRDPRWTRVAGSRKWAAYRRETDGPLAEEWMQQPFLDRRFGLKRANRAARGLARTALRRK